jgi:hypothetical protein
MLWRAALATPEVFETWTLPESFGTVRGMALGGTASRPLLFVLCGNVLRVCDPEPWPLVERGALTTDGGGYLGALGVAPGGARVAALMRRQSGTGAEGDTLYLWDLEVKGERVVGELVLRKPLVNTMCSVTFAPDGESLAVGLRRGLLTTLALDPPGEWVELGREDGILGRAHSSSVDDVAYSPDGRWLYSVAEFKSLESTGATEDRTGELVVWDASTGAAVRRVALAAPTQSIDVDGEGRLLLGLNRGIVQVWVGQ